MNATSQQTAGDDRRTPWHLWVIGIAEPAVEFSWSGGFRHDSIAE